MKSRTLFATLVACVLLCATAHAAPIPSSATADYAGNGWACRVLAYRHAGSAQHSVIELQCTGPDNRPRIGGSVTLGCPDTRTALRLYVPWTTLPDYATYITSYSPIAINLQINGASVSLSRVQTLPSPSPYPGCDPLRRER